MIYFLDKNKELNEELDYQHPWATSPKTFGSLASMYLAILFMKEDDEEEQEKEIKKLEIQQMSKQLIRFNAHTLILDNLKSEFEDRQELTILLIVFLVEENTTLQDYLIENKVFFFF